MICKLFISDGQNMHDSTLQLPTVQVIANEFKALSKPFSSEVYDRKRITQSSVSRLDELLSLTSNVSVRSYGSGNLATMSLRGATSNQSVLTWNGIPINNSMLGLADISNIPILLFDKIQIDYGGKSTLHGSSAIGGVVELTNTFDFNDHQKFEFQQELGSFNTQRNVISFSVGQSKMTSKTSMGFNSSKNNFSISSGAKQSNAAIQSHYLMQSLGFCPNPNINLAVHYWRQQANRQIPPSLRQNESLAFQKDAFDRLALKFHLTFGNWRLEGLTSIMSESLDYHDPQIRLNSLSNIRSQTARLLMRRKWSIISTRFGAEIRNHKAHSNNYSNNLAKQNYSSLFSQIGFNFTAVDVVLSLRQGFFNGSIIPIMPALDANYKVNPVFDIHVSAGRLYRIPSLNELFWIPGGNSTLIPEEGWQTNFSLKYHNTKGFTSVGSIFYRDIQNWLLWTLPEGELFFQAHNLDRIISQGAEFDLSKSVKLKQGHLRIAAGYTYVHSYSNHGLRSPKRERGQQLHYLPYQKCHSEIKYKFKNYGLSYAHQYQDAMDGFNKRVSSFNIGDLSLHYEWDAWKNHHLIVSGHIRNLWNHSYEVVEFRPMPGRSFFVIINYSIKSE